MPRRPTEAQVAFARLGFKGDQMPLIGAVPALEESLVPGTQVRRYDRVWHMARHRREGVWIYGRIGFVREGQAEGVVWDEKTKDFIEAPAPLAQTVPYAINIDALRVAFQLKGAVIKPGTFRGNFQALLQEAPPRWPWIVRLEGVQQPPWEEWRPTVDRIVKARIKMEKPNPRYPGEEVEALFEQAKIEAANLVLKAEKDASINLDADFVKQAIELAREHGDLNVTGVRTVEGREVQDSWSQSLEGQVQKTQAPIDPSTREVRPEDLRASLGGEDEHDQSDT